MRYILIMAAALVAGCTTKYVATPKPFCAAVTPVCVSKDDQLTEETASQIEANNLGSASACKKRVRCEKDSGPDRKVEGNGWMGSKGGTP